MVHYVGCLWQTTLKICLNIIILIHMEIGYILVRPCGWVTALNVLCCWPFFNVFIYQFHHVLLGVSIKFIIFHVKPVRGIIDTMYQSTYPTLMLGNLWENSAILRSESSRQLG